MKGFTKEVKIALTAIAALVILFFGMQFLKGLTLFSDNNTYLMVFDNVDGLGVSTPIYANGVKVGNVSSIEYDYEKGSGIVVEAALDKRLRVPQGTKAEIDKDLMGNMQVRLLMPTNQTNLLKPGDKMQGHIYSGALDAASAMVPDVQKMLPKLDSILASVNTLLANPALAQSLENMEIITANLTMTSRQANELMTALNGSVPQLAGKADGILAKADGTMANANMLTGNLAKLDVAPTIALVNTTLANTKDAMVKLNTSMNDINKLTADLNNQKGSLGMLMNDPNLYNNLSNTARSADSLLIDLKSHPKRYVHFSIFGRKDK